MSWPCFASFIRIAVSITFIFTLGCDRHPKAEQIFFNGTILTMAAGDAPAQVEALAVKDEKILAVGAREDIFKKHQGKQTTLRDLQGATLLPGFVSSHMHFLNYGLASEWIDVSSANTFFSPPPWKPLRRNSEILAKLKIALSQTPEGDWIKAFGMDPSRQIQDIVIDRAGLDELAPKNPIVLLNNSGHYAYVNTAALKKLSLCGVLAETPKDKCLDLHLSESEKANARRGNLQEAAVFAAVMAVAPKDITGWKHVAHKGAKILGARGYTTVSEGGVDAGMLKAYANITADPDFPLSVVALPVSTFYFGEKASGLKATLKDIGTLPPSLKVGPVKFFADGSPQGYSAFLLQAYKTRPEWSDPNKIYRGSLNTPKLLEKQIPEVHRRGDQVAIHNNGDGATEFLLDILSTAMEQHPRQDTRHQFIHSPFALSNPNLRMLERMKEMGFVVTFLTRNIYYWGQYYCQEAIGAERTRAIYPAKKAKDLGLTFSIHSDAPVNPPHPMALLTTAVTRKVQEWNHPFTAACPRILGPEQSISIEDGLKALTINAARQFFLEKEVGSLEPGKFADLAILQTNPLNLKATPEKLQDIPVLATVHRGKYFSWHSPATPTTNQSPTPTAPEANQP